MTHTNPIRPPWTPEQVDALNAFQQSGSGHPFTCGGEHAPGSPILVAREDGWHCSDPYGEGCDYRQDWAHASMVDLGRAAVSPGVSPATGHRLSVQHADALWDAIAIPGPDTPTFTVQHQRVCRAVADILDEMRPANPAALRVDVLRKVADICDEAASAYAAKGADDPNSPANTAASALFGLMERFQRKAEEAVYVATPCDPMNPCEDGGEPCHIHERLMAHAEGDHELCEPDCGTAPEATAVDDEPFCGAEPPTRADDPNGQWGDCWCTLPPGHAGEHRCEPCTERHGAPGWADAASPAAGAPRTKETDTDRTVAYRSALPGAMSIYCTRHTDELGTGVIPLTSDDLPDGGVCAQCHVDLLIPQNKEDRP